MQVKIYECLVLIKKSSNTDTAPLSANESWLKSNKSIQEFKIKIQQRALKTFRNWNASPLKNGETSHLEQLQISSKISACYQDEGRAIEYQFAFMVPYCYCTNDYV